MISLYLFTRLRILLGICGSRSRKFSSRSELIFFPRCLRVSSCSCRPMFFPFIYFVNRRKEYVGHKKLTDDTRPLSSFQLSCLPPRWVPRIICLFIRLKICYYLYCPFLPNYTITTFFHRQGLFQFRIDSTRQI